MEPTPVPAVFQSSELSRQLSARRLAHAIHSRAPSPSLRQAPALACGNCVIAKPSEITPRTAGALAQLLHAAGLPAGVFNLVHGLGAEAGAALVAHPDVHVISFTGGTATGRAVAAVAAPLFKKVSLELGGKASSAFREGGERGRPYSSLSSHRTLLSFSVTWILRQRSLRSCALRSRTMARREGASPLIGRCQPPQV